MKKLINGTSCFSSFASKKILCLSKVFSRKLTNIAFISFLLLTGFQCEDKIVPPDPLPPGYQEDIYWPSLADTPWPMFHHDPQNTGRSPYLGPTAGVIVGKIPSKNIWTGVVVGFDSTIFYTVSWSGRLIAADFNGNKKWELNLGLEGCTTPLIRSDSTIIIANSASEVLAVDLNGKIIWTFHAESQVYSNTIGISKEGNLFFIDNNRTLYSLDSQGNQLWKVTDTRFMTGIMFSPVFSPDGKTLYVTGARSPNPLILAIDASNGNVKWTWGEGSTENTPVIDSQGNLYFQKNPDLNSPGAVFYSISSSGELRWSFPYFSYQMTDVEAAIDKEGTLYFGYDTLYAVGYNGKLKWKYGFDKGNIYSPVICDRGGNIFVGVVGTETLTEPRIISLNKSGEKNWEIKIEGEYATGNSPAISKEGLLFYSTWWNSVIIIK